VWLSVSNDSLFSGATIITGISIQLLPIHLHVFSNLKDVGLVNVTVTDFYDKIRWF